MESTNKKIILAALAILVIGLLVYGVTAIDTKVSAGEEKYVNNDFNFSFDYPTGPEGYVLIEQIPTGSSTPFVVVLMRTEDEKNYRENPPVGGEGPAVISITVSQNSKKQTPLVWATENVNYSVINLKMKDPVQYEVDGMQGIRYPADGLYPADIAVIPSGNFMYVLNGQYMDAESKLKKDFQPIVDSLNFTVEQ